jgi:hypothetical protein
LGLSANADAAANAAIAARNNVLANDFMRLSG